MLISALYLAAGQSKRMGVQKQSLELAKNKPLASMGLQALLSSSLKQVDVVVHSEDLRSWIEVDERDIKSIIPHQASTFHVVVSAEASKGLSHSIRSGLESLLREEPALDAVVIALADQPFITSDMVNELIRLWSERKELDFVATAVHEEKEGRVVLMPPAIFSSSMFESILLLEGDAGARKLFESTKFNGYGLVAVDRRTSFDVDTPADFELAKKYYMDFQKEH